MSAATLATRVKAAREGAELSQRQLLGVDQAVISKIEAGKITDPGIATMTAIAKATGRTIEELTTGAAAGVRSIELRELTPDPNNPRTIGDDATDQAFVESIRTQGLLQALAVRRYQFPDSGNWTWLVVDGHRRYAALSIIHGPKSKQPVPCRVVVEEDGAKVLLLQLVANVQRADMNPWDLARGIGDLVEAGMDTQAIAEALGRKRRWVQEQASVGRGLHNGARNALQSGRITISQAVAIAAEKDEKEQNKLVTQSCDGQLNEDEIRAITADRKDKAAEEKDARERSQQLDIEDFAPGKGKTYPTPNENGVFQGKPTVTVRWTHKRGYMGIELVQYGDHKWCAGLDLHWRTSGRSHAAGRDDYKQQNAPVCFLDVARTAYGWLCSQAKDHPEDLPAMHQLHDWIATQLVKLHATARVQADWKNNNPPPAKAKAKSAAKAKAPPAPKPVDISAPPTWAQPIAEALFMYHDGRQAFLCKGWAHMAKTFSDHLDADQEELRQLYNRSAWASDLDGKPFDFGGAVVRLKDAPA